MDNTTTLEEAIIIRDTDEAYFIEYEGTQTWIAKSLVENLDKVNAEYTNAGGGQVEIEELIIPEWLAIGKGLI